MVFVWGRVIGSEKGTVSGATYQDYSQEILEKWMIKKMNPALKNK